MSSKKGGESPLWQGAEGDVAGFGKQKNGVVRDHPAIYLSKQLFLPQQFPTML
ncbi:MAG: hypothetical protein HZC44_07870 [Geobacter sp.]|nr:hypothetical protein [Geobacter sp.]